ncbi:MAG: methylmalonyl-CoA mutase family protein, partial [Thermodesulfobacteriota bacterium]|nr:methylmalonyl-CoA mutase family protein [Thermodesulfobacteriota bacterium]
YFVEWLTSRMEEEIQKILDQIEHLGGYLKCWESGWLRGQVEVEAAKRFRKLQTGELVKVGVNKYKMEQVSEVKTYRCPPEIEEKAVKRVRRHRERRDVSRVQAALEKVNEAAGRIDAEWPASCGVLMPALIEAARSGATNGEMHRILRDVFGYGYFSG